MLFFEFLQNTPSLFIPLIAILTLCIGSFLNVVIYRLPLMLHDDWRKQCHDYLAMPEPEENNNVNLFFPRSKCPNCNNTLAIYHNIPLFSYLFLKGKCGFCKTNIPFQYPLVELTSCLLGILLSIQFGLTWALGLSLIFCWSLIVLSFIDLKHMLLPDNLTLSILWLGLFANIFGLFTNLESAVLGALAGYLILWFIANLFKLITKKTGMGNGDFKLLAMLGAWLGWQALPFILILSAGIGALVGISLIAFRDHEKSQPIPFGPYLALAGIIAMFFRPALF